METIYSSIALIRNTDNQNVRWLARLNQSTNHLGFVIGERLANESFRETAIREVAWELRLDRQRDFLVANMAQMNLEFIDRLPGQFEKSHVVASFYNVEIYRKGIMASLESDSQNFWVSSEEICNGVSQCGRHFDPIVPYLVNRSNVIQYWESSSGN
jgi:hypothetical protein